MPPFTRCQFLIPLALAVAVGILATVRFLNPRDASTEKPPMRAEARPEEAGKSPFGYSSAPDTANIVGAARASGGVAVTPKPDPQALARAILADRRQPRDARVRSLKTVVAGKSSVDFDAVIWTFHALRSQ